MDGCGWHDIEYRECESNEGTEGEGGEEAGLKKKALKRKIQRCSGTEMAEGASKDNKRRKGKKESENENFRDLERSMWDRLTD